MDVTKSHRLPAAFFGVLAGSLFLLGYFFLWRPPTYEVFPKIIEIPKGTTIRQAADILEDKDLISSPFSFMVGVKLFSRTGVKAGTYRFDHPIRLFTAARRLSSGDSRIPPVRITFPEGLSVKEMAAICAEKLPLCKKSEFIILGMPFEGYLFPDTYDFSAGAEAKTVIEAMRKEFDSKITSLDKEIKASGRPISQIIIMASLLEEEARTLETRRMISGILWKRLQIGMPLQVDAVFPYIIGKDTFSLTSEDLAYDSPYNTYLHVGFPPGPIASPGLEAIKAAITPITSAYLYYLSDREGNVYYSKTHEEHIAKKLKYLN